MSHSAEQLQSFLHSVDQEVLRLGTRDHITAASIAQAAITQNWSSAVLGDSLASALSTDRNQWYAIRRCFARHYAPPLASPPRWSGSVHFALLSVAILLVVALAVWRVASHPRPPTPSQIQTNHAELVDLGAAVRSRPKLHPPPQISTLQPIVQQQKIVPRAERPSLTALSAKEWAWLSVSSFCLSLLASFLPRLLNYLRHRRKDRLAVTRAAAAEQHEDQLRAQTQTKYEMLVQSALETGKSYRPPYHIELQPPLGSEVIEDSATLLGRAFRTQLGSELDVEATIEATLMAGGQTAPMFLPMREARELIVLYDDTATRPYLPGFLKLIELWQRRGVHIVTLRFERHPTTLLPKEGRARTVELLDLVRHYEGATLLLYASRLAVRSRDRDLEWPRALRLVTVCAWLDPDPRLPAEREPQEQAELEVLAPLVPRFPLTAAGLLSLARYIGAPKEGAWPPVWAPPPPLADATMAHWVELWLALGAQVPDAAMEQFEAVRQKLLSAQLPDVRSIGRLVERLRQILGTSYNPSKPAVELGWKRRAALLGTLLRDEPALFRRGFELLLESLGAAPQRVPGESLTLQEYEWQQRKLWYQAGLDLERSEEIISALDSTPMRESAQEIKKILYALRTRQEPADALRPVTAWPAPAARPLGRSPRLITQGTLTAILVCSGMVLTFVLVELTLTLAGKWPRLPEALRPWSHTLTATIASSIGEQVVSPYRPPVIISHGFESAGQTEAKQPKRIESAHASAPELAKVRQRSEVIKTAPPEPAPSAELEMVTTGAESELVGMPSTPSLLVRDGGVDLDLALALAMRLDAGVDLGAAVPPEVAVQPVAETRYRPKMVTIPAGRFLMGSPSGQGDSDEHPQLAVVIGRRFLLSETEVTQQQYLAVMGRNPAYFRDHPSWARLPVESVTWSEAIEYCNRLSIKDTLVECYSADDAARFDWRQNKSCTGYRLPTEAEWEYAARAGGRTQYAGSDQPEDVAWYDATSQSQTHPVKTKRPNAWGLYDMSGNVWEWVWDWYNGYSNRFILAKTSRVLRGGSWGNGIARVRVAFRGEALPAERSPGQGFRVARSGP